MKTHVVYIPGLGDKYDAMRRFALLFWRILGVSTEYVPIGWYDGGEFEQKMASIEGAIKRAGGERVVLIGESAGATLALHAGERYPDKIDRIITLCGVAQAKTPISNYLQSKAPALKQAAQSLPSTYKVDVHSVRAVLDGVVNKRWSIATGATAHTVWTIGHLTTIAACLTVLAPLMVTIAKK